MAPRQAGEGEARNGMARDGAAGKAGERGNPGSKEGLQGLGGSYPEKIWSHLPISFGGMINLV